MPSARTQENTRKRRSFASILVHTCHLSLAFPTLIIMQPVKSNQSPDMQAILSTHRYPGQSAGGEAGGYKHRHTLPVHYKKGLIPVSTRRGLPLSFSPFPSHFTFILSAQVTRALKMTQDDSARNGKYFFKSRKQTNHNCGNFRRLPFKKSMVTSNSSSFVANVLSLFVRQATAIFHGPWLSFSRAFRVVIEHTVPSRSLCTKGQN